MGEARRIVLLGAMGQMPVAGVVWQVLHYLEGFMRLGHEVAYVEDTGSWPYDPDVETVTDDARGAARRLAGLLDPWVGRQGWAFVNAARPAEVAGMGAQRLRAVMRDAELLVNLSGVTVLRGAHLEVPVRIYLETDPVTPQLEMAEGRQSTVDLLGAHTHHFTFGERIGQPGCAIPPGPFRFRLTRQPVVLDWWASPPPRREGPARFTTVAAYRQPAKDVAWKGERYGWSKSEELAKLDGVPGRVPAVLELALACDDRPAIEALQRTGWRIVPAAPLSRDPAAYREYIRGSDAEFTVAKDQNVRLRSGWFSDRTATYLAAGRPVVVQDTGFDVALPIGKGLLSFRTPEEAVAAIAEVAGDLPRQARAARAIAEAHFRAEDVLGRLLAEVGA
ncbi:MAG: hypothetical protein ACR2NB_01690 [Solirubrobacteraceae bacterium]